MKTIRSSHFASAAIIALLALPTAALAQPTQSPASAAPPAAASSPMTSQPVPGKSMEERVENRIKQLHTQLQITPAEQPQWDQFAQVMRENARDMDQAFIQRAQQYPTNERDAEHAVLRADSRSTRPASAKAGPGLRQLVQRDARAAEKADGPGVPGQCRAAGGAIASRRDRKLKPVYAGAQALQFLAVIGLSGPCRGDALPPKILGESARALTPS